MTRIVAGLARGRRLAVPPAGTRPTSDRAREAMFDTLDTLLDLDDATVVDLYAGSGAVGLEALSRGASGVELVERDRAAAAVCRANAAAVGLPGARVVVRDAAGFARAAGPPVDLVFADPPYAMPDSELAAVLGALCDRLTANAVVVVERSARGAPWSWPTPLQAVRHKRYGEAVLWYGRRADEAGPDTARKPSEN